jgi:pseudouridine-5'-phosphate glycosidase/pseudouridine kinase
MQAFGRSFPLVGRWACRRQTLNASRSSLATATASFSTTGRPLSGNLAGLKDILKVSEEVTEALATNKPVVALETTIYTHGALGDLDLEGIVRRNGGVPAVVGILGGVPTVGLVPEEVTRIVEGAPKKVSRRDIAYLVGSVRRDAEQQHHMS